MKWYVLQSFSGFEKIDSASNLNGALSVFSSINRPFKSHLIYFLRFFLGLLKKVSFSKKTKMICLADDSGLEIDSLDRFPGIYSARWGGKKSNFNLAIKRVYKELKKNDVNWYKIKQTARFVCTLTVYWPNNKFINVSGKVEGTISRFKKGNNGFGYDPIFYYQPHACTLAELSREQKIAISHRGQAFRQLRSFLATWQYETHRR